MKLHHLLLPVLLATSYLAYAQSDSTAQSTYFLEQNALPTKRGNLVYNNYYLFINTLSYTPIKGLKVSAGAFIINQRPPFFAQVQYSVPIANRLYLGGSVGYYQLDYDEYRSNYMVIPQLLLTSGDEYTNTTFNAGVVRGRYLFGGGILTPSPINLPSRVNWVLGLSHRRPLFKNISLITQNAYVSAQAPAGSDLSEVVMLSVGGGWHFERKHALKLGLAALYVPKREQTTPLNFAPFLGYSLFIR